MTKNITKFEWNASDSGPDGYPMEIIRGTFLYKDQDVGLYIPAGGTLDSGWGKPISYDAVGEDFKPLPDRLKITFFSYAEKQFYSGEFQLPYEKILKLFKDGVGGNSELPTYAQIIVGIAPGGVVAVWLDGQKTTEIFFGQAEKTELNTSVAFDLPFQSKEQSDAYIAKQLVNSLTKEQRDNLDKNGIPFDLWHRYRNRYHWMPGLSTGYKIPKIRSGFVNGEFDRVMDYYSESALKKKHPVPNYLSFVNNREVYEVNFDEQEIMLAFETLAKEDKMIYMEIDAKTPHPESTIRLFVVDGPSIPLKKAIFENNYP